MSYNLQALGATVEHLERLTTETAEEVKNVGRTVGRMEGHIESQSKQIERLHHMVDSLIEKMASRKDVDEIEVRVDKLEKAPAEQAKALVDGTKKQLWTIAVTILGTAGIGAIIYVVAESIMRS